MLRGITSTLRMHMQPVLLTTELSLSWRCPAYRGVRLLKELSLTQPEFQSYQPEEAVEIQAKITLITKIISIEMAMQKKK